MFRLHEESGKLLVHSLNEGGSAMASDKIKEGDVLLQVSRVDVTNCPRPVDASTFLTSMCAIEYQTRVFSNSAHVPVRVILSHTHVDTISLMHTLELSASHSVTR